MATPYTEPPLIDVKVDNPVTYFRRFWEKVIGNEGMELKLTIKPLTTIFGIALLGTIAFGLGKFVIPEGFKIPFIEFSGIPTTTPTSTTETIWKETGFTGKLQYSATNNKYFLITTSSKAITLNVPDNLNLFTLIGKRIFAVGEYDKKTKILKVIDIKDLEVLPTTPIPIPTVEATSTPTHTPTASPSASPIDVIDNEGTNL